MTRPVGILYWATAASFGPAYVALTFGVLLASSTMRAPTLLGWIDIAVNTVVVSLAFITTAVFLRRVIARREPWIVVALTLAFPLVSGLALIGLQTLQRTAMWMRGPSPSDLAYSVFVLLNASFFTGAIVVLPCSWLAVIALRWAHRRSMRPLDAVTSAQPARP